MATKTNRKPKAPTAAANKAKARKTGRTAGKAGRTAGKAAPSRKSAAAGSARAKQASATRPSKAARAKKPAAKPAARGKARANGAAPAPEKVALSPRVSAALKAAAWAADWVAAQGRFVWHDLMTSDAATARDFYTQLFGWRVQELNMAGFTVLLLKNDDRSIGTIMAETSLPSSHWMPYVAVADVEAACRRVTELGGSIGSPAASAPKLGRFAIVSDPQGGTFSPLKRPNDVGPPPDPSRWAPGDFCWEELVTPDPESAASFYAALCGWQVELAPMSQPYWMAKNDGLPVGGLTQPAPGVTPDRPYWLPYIGVDDVDDTAARATDLGATVTVPPTDIPGMGRFAILTDPVGAAVGLFAVADAGASPPGD